MGNNYTTLDPRILGIELQRREETQGKRKTMKMELMEELGSGASMMRRSVRTIYLKHNSNIKSMLFKSSCQGEEKGQEEA